MTMSAIEFGSVLRRCAAQLPDDVLTYLEGLKHLSLGMTARFLLILLLDVLRELVVSQEEAYIAILEAIDPFLRDINLADDDISRIAKDCTELMIKGNHKFLQSDPVALEKPILIEKMAEGMAKEARDVNSWMIDSGVDLQVDKAKLLKAELRIKEKQEKRKQDGVRQTQAAVQKAADAQPLDEAFANLAVKRSGNDGRVRDIKIENFDLAYYGRVLLIDSNLTLTFGRRYGLIGRNGIGKSTLLKCFYRREVDVPRHVSIVYVEQEVAGDETSAIDAVLKVDVERTALLREEKVLASKVQSRDLSQVDEDSLMAPQYAKDAARLNEIYQRLEEIEADKAEGRAATILCGLGFANEQHRWPTKSFSGGWRMRIALAQALFGCPDLLLLDEPTNMLDIRAVIWLESYLQSWPTTLLVVSHDREFLNAVTTDIVHMQNQTLETYRGNYEVFNRTRTERQTNQQREFESQQMYRQHLQAFVDRWRCNANRASQAQSKLKILEKLPDLKAVEEEAGVKFKFLSPEPLVPPPLVQLQEVTFSYQKDSVSILRNISVTLTLESRVALVGPNGAGKSTLIKLIVGENEPTLGRCQRHRKLRIGYFSQHHVDQLDLKSSPLDFLRSKFANRTLEEYRHQLGAFGVTGALALQTIATLSGGQKSRVAFAAMAMSNPHLLVLDEPTNHLDMETIDGLSQALKVFTGGVLIVSHDERLVMSACKELWVCENGSVARYDGSFSDYRKVIEKAIVT